MPVYATRKVHMSHHLIAATGAATICIVGVLTTSLAGQSVPRTTWGDPDLEGVFTFATITPGQRPDDVAGKEVLTEEEARVLEERTARERVAWTQPCSATFPRVRIDGEVFEYACHEGNYSMANILSGARADESRSWCGL